MVMIYSTTGSDTRNGTCGNATANNWNAGIIANSPSDNNFLFGNGFNNTLDGGMGNGSLGKKVLKSKHEENGKQTTKNSTNLGLFANGCDNTFSSSKVMWEVSNILTRKQDLFWLDDADGKCVYTSEFKDGKGEIVFWVTDDPKAQRPKLLAGRAAMAVIEDFDIRAVCMHLIYAAQVMSLETPWLEEFVIDARQIASYLGLDKRKDLSKQDKLKLIEHLALQPTQIWTCLRWPAQGKIEAFYMEKSRLWEISVVHCGKRVASDQTEGKDLIIKGRAGLWAKYFLNRQGQAESKAFYQYGVLSKKLLQTITKYWQHNEGAARMLAWLTFKTRVGSSQRLIVGTLMEVAYGPKKVAAAQSDPKLRTKLANTWDNDLLVLNDVGWRIEFDTSTYPPEVQPDWNFIEGERNRDKRPKGFWDQLRNGRMLVHPPPEIQAGLAQLQGNKQTLSQPRSKSVLSKPPEAIQPLGKEQIKAAREAKGWSQSRLAIEMGKSKMWISLIERGLRQLKMADQKKLCRILDIKDQFYLVG